MGCVKSLFLGIFLFLFLSQNIYGQNVSFTISGSISDKETGKSLAFASIVLQGTSIGTVSNSEGHYSITIKKTDSLTLVFSFIGYKSDTITINLNQNKVLNVSLTPEAKELSPVKITVGTEVNIFFGQDEINVFDYEFYEDKYLFIVYEGRLEKSKLIITNHEKETLAEIQIPETPIEFFRGCVGNVHIIAEDSAYQIKFDNGQLYFLSVPIKNFNRVLKPCVATSGNYWYYEKYSPDKLSLTYYFFHLPEKTITDIKTITDQNTRTFLANSFPDLEAYYSNEMEALSSSGMARLIAINHLMHEKDAEKEFLNKVIYQPVKAYLELINDSIYVFDFYNKNIVVYDTTTNFSKGIKINYSQQKDWNGELIYDDIFNELYTVFEKGGFIELRRIVLSNGTLQGSTSLVYQFPEKIRVHGGDIYYLYRSDSDYGKTYLYRQKIN